MVALQFGQPVAAQDAEICPECAAARGEAVGLARLGQQPALRSTPWAAACRRLLIFVSCVSLAHFQLLNGLAGVTLILYYLTPEFVVQVADRRLTYVRGDQPVLAEDNRNKLVLYCSRMAFSYTGLARLGGQYTDEWLTKTLASLPYISAFDAARLAGVSAAEGLKSVALSPSSKRLTFVGVGWERLANDDHVPVMYRVSNCQNERGQLTPAGPEFTVLVRHLGRPSTSAWGLAGQSLSGKIRKQTVRALDECRKHRAGPEAITRVLVEAVRAVADSNPAVGKDILSVHIHRPARPVQAVTATQPSDKALADAYCGYYPANKETPIHYAPSIACAGAKITNIEFHVE